MKRILFCLAVAWLAGCSVNDEPGPLTTMIRDPHFAEYQQQSDDLEHRYLQHKITYAEYQDDKARLDEQYTQEVHEREEIIYDSGR